MICNGTMGMLRNSPLIRITEKNTDNINLYVKYEGVNPTGSIKDRAAKYVIDKSLKTNKINHDTIIIESSSGNFGIALSSYCKTIGLKCSIVIDPNILPINEYIIRNMADEVIKVTERDYTGGFLLTRTNYIRKTIAENDNYFWTNQYENWDIAEAYYSTVGEEIVDELDLDYIFVGVSSGGTITGISNKIKERVPSAKVIAVDVFGSVVFSEEPKKRYIPGIGASRRPPILDKAIIDDVVLIEEKDSIDAGIEFFKNNYLLIGGSSACVYYAIKKYFQDKKFNKKPNVVALFPDRGEKYFDRIYNDEWVKKNFTASQGS